MPQLEHIEAIEKRLWTAADNLRANSNYASNEYFLPVMGMVFLRHAYSRYLMAKDRIEPTLPSRGGKTRPITKEDFSKQSAIFLQPKAQFDHLVSLPDTADRARTIIEAMESIEADYENLRGVLPKGEYQELAIFDLLRKPELTAKEIKQIKKVAVELLTVLKGRIKEIDHWRDRETTRDALRVEIHNFLYSDATGLPEDFYTEDDVEIKTDEVFQHVFRAYPKIPSPFYEISI